MFFILKNEYGQGMVEYALILALIAVVVLAIMLILGPVVGNMFSVITCNMAWC
jgi:pilus assembly protein Flp/PilA